MSLHPGNQKNQIFCETHVFVNRVREIVSFGHGKELEKDVFHLVTSMGQRKNSESP